MEKITNVKALNYVLENCPIPDDVRAKLEKMVETASKKGSSERKPTAQEQANNAIRKAIVELCQANPEERYTITDFMSKVPDLPEGMTNQRMNTLVMHLLPSYGDGKTGTGELIRVQDKRKTYFMANPEMM